jgi:hypothetical protein
MGARGNVDRAQARSYKGLAITSQCFNGASYMK